MCVVKYNIRKTENNKFQCKNYFSIFIVRVSDFWKIISDCLYNYNINKLVKIKLNMIAQKKTINDEPCSL